jgi:hypothetical protein
MVLCLFNEICPALPPESLAFYRLALPQFHQLSITYLRFNEQLDQVIDTLGRSQQWAPLPAETIPAIERINAIMQ